MPPCYNFANTASQLQARINHCSDKMSSFPSWANRRLLKHPCSNQDSAISDNSNYFLLLRSSTGHLAFKRSHVRAEAKLVVYTTSRSLPQRRSCRIRSSMPWALSVTYILWKWSIISTAVHDTLCYAIGSCGLPSRIECSNGISVPQL